MKTSCALVLSLSLLVSCATPRTGMDLSYKSVEMNRFVGGQLAKEILLSFDIPAQYDRMPTGIAADASSYWMPAAQFLDAKKSGDLPDRTGYLTGRISLNVGYDSSSGTFSNEKGLVEMHREMGFDIRDVKRSVANGYPLLSYTVIERSTRKVFYGMYVGLNISTNAYYICYMPPNRSRKIGDEVWNHLLKSMK